MLTHTDIELIINDEAEGWQHEDSFELDGIQREVWFFPAAHMYLEIQLTLNGVPIDWYEVQPVDVTVRAWEIVEPIIT